MASKAARRDPEAARSSVVERWLTTQTSSNTRAAYSSDLNTFATWCARQGEIPLVADAATLIAFQAAREASGDSASTIRRRWSALSSFYDFAVEQRLRPANPTVGVRRPKVQSGDPSPTVRLSDAAVASCRTIAAALDPRLDALVALLVLDGLKVSEALALDVDDITGRPPTTSLTVRRGGTSKRIVLDSETAAALRRCVGKRRGGPVFVSEQSTGSKPSRRLTRFGADHLIRQLNTRSTSERVTANALRRFHINSSEADGTDLEDIRDRAGLADVRSVRRYVNSTTNEEETS